MTLSETTTEAVESAPTKLATWQRVAVVALLAWYSISALTAVSTKCAAVDEFLHLTGGVTYWKFNDYRIHPENGNLPQRWAALPVVLAGYEFPSIDQQDWRQSHMDRLSNQFFFGLGNNVSRMLLVARAAVVVLAVALGLLIFMASRALLGTAAGFVSLTLFAFCPTMLNNGALVTSDMAAALFFFASVGCLWKVLNHVSWLRLLVSALLMGAVLVSKVSGLLILPMAVVLVIVQLVSTQPICVSWRGTARSLVKRSQRLAVLSGITLLHALICYGVIWTFYGFHYEMLHATTVAQNEQSGESAIVDKAQYSWDQLAGSDAETIDRCVNQLRAWHALPEAYLYGVTYILHFADQRRAFFWGEYGKGGWPLFFPFTVATKTPLPLFVLLALAIAALARAWYGSANDCRAERRSRLGAALYRSAPYWTLTLVYWAFALVSTLNVGHRHILPTYPPMLMLAGASAWWLTRRVETSDIRRLLNFNRPAVAWVTLCCVALFAADSLRSWPNYPAYFNQLIGGQNAYRYLVDSSLDWGQDLPGLKRWLDEQQLDNGEGHKVYLSYFGLANPDYYGIRFEALPSMPALVDDQPLRPLGPGTYCISATMLNGVYNMFPGRWNPEYEQLYQQMRSDLARIEATADDADARAKIVAEAGGDVQLAQWFRAFDSLRLARLCNYLLAREPDDEINYSILVYRLKESDLQAALDGPPPASN